MSTKIILVDDHAALRSGIKSYLTENSDYVVEFEEESFEKCEKLLEEFNKEKLNPKNYIAVVDISFKSENREIKHEENSGFLIIKIFSELGIKCIAFSSHDSGGFIEHSLKVGAKGFVSKNAEENILLEAIKTVDGGKTYIQPDLISNLLEVRNVIQTFTKKEKLIAQSLTLYKSNAELAKELKINEKTLSNYLSILYDKTGASGKVELLEKLGKL